VTEPACTLASWPSQRRPATAISLPRRLRTKLLPRALRAASPGTQEPAGVVKRSTWRIARVRALALRAPLLVAPRARTRVGTAPRPRASNARPNPVSAAGPSERGRPRFCGERAPRRRPAARTEAARCRSGSGRCASGNAPRCRSARTPTGRAPAAARPPPAAAMVQEAAAEEAAPQAAEAPPRAEAEEAGAGRRARPGGRHPWSCRCRRGAGSRRPSRRQRSARRPRPPARRRRRSPWRRQRRRRG
jgi:hypothetical protein